MVVVAIVAPYILGALFGLLGAVLQGIGSFLGTIGGFLGQTLPLLGQVLGGALRVAGNLINFTGQVLSRAGTNLMTQAKQLFNDLREQGLKSVFQSFKDRILEKINPTTSYQNTWKSLTEGVNKLASRTGFSRFLGNVMEQLGVQIAQEKIDKSLEKSKMNSFLKSILSTVANAGIQAIGSAVTDGIFPPQTSPAEATGSRAPPTGSPGFFERIQNAFSSVAGLVTDGLKDATGFIRSLFIHSSDLPSNAGIEFPDSSSGEILFNDQGNPISYKLSSLAPDISYNLESLSSGLTRADLGGGDYQFFRFDPQNPHLLQGSERVGNLQSTSSFVDQARLVADRADSFLGAVTDPLIDFLGPVGISSASTLIFLGREYAKGFIDTMRFGDQFQAIRSDFLSAQASFQKGDYLDAAKSFGSAGLRGLTEVGRFANLLPLAGLATKGIGGGAQRVRILANLAESQAARTASRFGLEGFNDGIQISRRSAFKLLTNRGIDAGKAKDFLNSFDGPLTVRRAKPEEIFNRYTKYPNSEGYFLTKDSFDHNNDAVLELVLNPKRNDARFIQTVTSSETPIVIEGQIQGSFTNRRQYFINPDDFRFSRGRRYGR